MTRRTSRFFKLLLAFLAFEAAPARAADWSMGGYGLFYGLMLDQDSTSSLREGDIRRRVKLTLKGEEALRDDARIGMVVEINADRANDRILDESFLYLQDDWGRVHFGETDGAAAYLQVEAPAADPYVDGIDPKINSFNLPEMGGGAVPSLLEYYQEPTGKTAKLLYATPKIAGFQAAASFAPSLSDAPASGDAAFLDDEPGEFENGAEFGVLYEKEWDEAKVSLGAGYSHLAREAAGDDRRVWNMGAAVHWDKWGVGAATLQDDRGLDGGEADIRVVGLSYKVTDRLTAGGSYYTREDGAAFAGVADAETDRIAAGLAYEMGPGLVFNGSIQRIDLERGVVQGQGTQVSLGAQLGF